MVHECVGSGAGFCDSQSHFGFPCDPRRSTLSLHASVSSSEIHTLPPHRNVLWTNRYYSFLLRFLEAPKLRVCFVYNFWFFTQVLDLLPKGFRLVLESEAWA